MQNTISIKSVEELESAILSMLAKGITPIIVSDATEAVYSLINAIEIRRSNRNDDEIIVNEKATMRGFMEELVASFVEPPEGPQIFILKKGTGMPIGVMPEGYGVIYADKVYLSYGAIIASYINNSKVLN